jgi:hypothetical protein
VTTSKRYEDGSIVKSSDDFERSHYSDTRVDYPVLGVVLEVIPSDHSANKSAADNALLRGFYWEATVAIVNDGKESSTAPLEHVLIAPNGPSGIDNFTQDLPTPTTGLVDGSTYKGNLTGIDLDKLNGDRCLVQFIGGKYNQPVMTSWMPHPANRRDPSTAGFAPDSLDQGRPFLQRRSGTTMAVTPEGTIKIDTNGAGSLVRGTPSGYTRTNVDYGGDILIDIKPERTLRVDFNEQLFVAAEEPSLLQPNPPPSEVAFTEPIAQDDSKTVMSMDKDFFLLAAGSLISLQALAGDIVLVPSDKLLFGDEESEENMVLGQKWKETMILFFDSMIHIIEELQTHTHATGMGPSGPPMEPFQTEAATVTGELQGQVDVIDDNLSDYIFGSKEAPVDELYDKEEETGEE